MISRALVINPAISLLGSDPSRLPIVNGSDTYSNPIDIGLLDDLCKNHYPQIKEAWNSVVKLYNRKGELNDRINQSISVFLQTRLAAMGLQHKISMYNEPHPPKNAIPIKEVTDRLRGLVENGRYELEIDSKLVVVTHHDSRSDIHFKDGSHPDIYAIQGEKSREVASEIRSELRQIFDGINSNDDTRDFLRKYEDSKTDSEKSRIKLHRMLNELAHKTKLNILNRCTYLSPKLGSR
jgi:hypothetical protein